MKRKGFTLIELLAVIVILAVIALITTTVIIKVVENARKNAAKNGALNYLDSVEKYIMYHDVDDTKYPYDLKDNTWNIIDTTTKEISLLNIIPSVKAEEVEVPPLNDFIKVSGSKPTSGTITIDNKGKITNAVMVIQKYNVTCTSSTSCNVEGKDADPTPILTIGNVTSDNTSITIPYTVEIEKGSVTVDCIYGTDTKYGQKGVINEENNTCTLSNLTAGTTYYFKLTPKSDKNKKGSSQTSSKTTASYIPATEFKVGDYIKMTPSYKGSYTPTTDSSSPYYTGTNTPGSITPSELDTWVVIRKNDDGTIDMVSLNVSSTNISFYGQTGWNNFEGALSKIAEQYENDKFTNGSREMGYLPGSSYVQCNSPCPNVEYYYEVDANLVKNAMGVRETETLVSNNPSGIATGYWLGTKGYLYKDGDHYHGYIVKDGGSIEGKYLNRPKWEGQETRTFAIRPVLTLKQNVVADSTGDGTKEHPWVLVEQ